MSCPRCYKAEIYCVCGTYEDPNVSAIERHYEKEITRLKAENKRLRELVKSAYIEGFDDGYEESINSHHGLTTSTDKECWACSESKEALNPKEAGE